MSVKFVSITEPITGLDGKNYFLSPEEMIVYIARVSNPGNQANRETAPKLLKYLIQHKHWSPFEFIDMTVEITTIDPLAFRSSHRDIPMLCVSRTSNSGNRL
jgi:thymidylate synthase (FAD)